MLATAAVATAAGAASPGPPSARVAAAPPATKAPPAPRAAAPAAPAPAPARPTAASTGEDTASADLSAYASDELAPAAPAATPEPAPSAASAPTPVKSPSGRFAKVSAPPPGAPPARAPRTQTFGPPPEELSTGLPVAQGERTIFDQLNLVPRAVWAVASLVFVVIGFLSFSSGEKYSDVEMDIHNETKKLERMGADPRGKAIEAFKKKGIDLRPEDIQMIIYQDPGKDSRVYAYVTVKKDDNVLLQMKTRLNMQDTLQIAMAAGFDFVKDDHSKIWPEPPSGARHMTMILSFALALGFVVAALRLGDARSMSAGSLAPAAPAAPVYRAPDAPARPTSARFSRPVEQGASAVAAELPPVQRPRTQTFGQPPSASLVSTPRRALADEAAAAGEIGKLFHCFGTVLVRGGPLAAGMALVTAPIATVLAGLAIYVTAHLGLIVFIFTVFNAISLAIAVTIAGPLATFLIASTEESPKPDVVLKLALSRAPSLAWFILVMFFIQIAIGIPVYLAFGSSGPLIGSILGFFVVARFWTLGVGYTVAFNAPFGETLTKVMALGEGRFGLLCVAAGIPRVLQTLIGHFGATWVVKLGADGEPTLSKGRVAAVAVALIATFLIDMAFSASALAVASRPGANAPS